MSPAALPALPETTKKAIAQCVPLGVDLERRSGDRVPFVPEPIFKAIYKALDASKKETELKDADLKEEAVSLTEVVVKALMRHTPESGAVHLEDVQDQVELALMRAGYYQTAKNYIKYREERARQRNDVEELQHSFAGRLSSMHVIKRDGTKQAVSLDKITNRVMSLSKDLEIDPILVSQKAIAGLYDGITTSEIDEYLAETAASLTTDHPDYAVIAARIKAAVLHYETGGFAASFARLRDAGMLNEAYCAKVEAHMAEIESIINYDLDYEFDYFAFTTLYKAYLMKVDGKPAERPQDMWMRCALTVTGETFDKEQVKKTYDLLSQGFYTHATPTLFNSGGKLQQLSSCFLIAMEDDSIDGIFNTVKDCALVSKSAGGIGLHIHNVRANGTLIKTTGGRSNGIVPFLKVFNETVRAVDQGGGKRKGVAAIYLEPWHGDIEAFLELRKNTGAEEFRTRDLFLAMWLPDLFMQRVEEDGDWTLMSENMCPGLSDAYGKDFVKLYEKYEAEGKGIKTVKAREIMAKIIESQIETGQPYMLYKDAINEKSNQKNLGTIKSSNLCAEIVEYSDKDETAVCNLASLALPKFVDTAEGTYDYQGLYDVAYTAAMNLNNVIDVNFYPTPKTQRSNMRHRPVGLGIQGLAEVYFKLKLPYDSDEARVVNRNIFETIYFAAVTASKDIAKQDGTYETYKGSPISKGVFQFDMWDERGEGAELSGLWDWDSLRKEVKKHGVRNSLLTACMPTASTGIILGNTETFQVQTSNIYKRQTISGEFLLINRFLVQELMLRDLWSQDMRNKIILENGSIQNIEEIPEDLKAVYRTVWETSQKIVIDMAKERAPFIDQTQSMNLWLEDATFGQVNSMHFYAWKAGLKTGMYYLRSKPAATAVKVTVNQDKNQTTEAVAKPELTVVEGEQEKAALEQAKAQVECTDEVCLVCSA